MRKIGLGLVALAASALASGAHAADVNTTTNLAASGTSSINFGGNGASDGGQVNCATICTFTATFNFLTPAGFNLEGVSFQTNYTTLNQNINFTNTGLLPTTLNGIPINLTPNGQYEAGTLFGVSTTPGANNTLVISGTAGVANDGATDANFSGTITFGTAAVPEPATWAMMLVGFGAVGFGMRRRNARSSTVRLQAA